MGCCSGDREKGPRDESQKWDFITLTDFRCTSAWTYVAYVWLWILAIVGVAVYVVDTFTAVQLLVFNRWSSSVKPALEFKYSKWIFAVCICMSWALCFYEWIRAMRVIKRGGVAESFLDPLAVDIQSMRPQGFKRFLVFSALAKSKKGADYVALFVYFSFKTAIRVILAEGPRQGVNAMTLWAVLQSDIAVKGPSDHSAFDQFWLNIGALAEKDVRQACIYFAMLFTLVIWVFSALSLIVSVVLYLFFLWHYIPSRDGRLSVYCKRKVDRRLEKVVEHKVKAAIEEEERQTQKAERKAELKRQKTGEVLPPNQMQYSRKPTLPEVGRMPSTKSDEKAQEFALSRSNTDLTLPPYTSHDSNEKPISRQPTLPNVGDVPRRPVGQPRTDTQASTWSNAPSYASDAPLVSNTGFAPEDNQDFDHYNAPLPPLPHMRSDSQSTLNSQRSFHHPGGIPGGPPGPGPRMPPQRSNTGFIFEQIQEPYPPQSANLPRPPPHAAQSGYFPRAVPGPAGMMPCSATVDANTQPYARKALPERSATAGSMPGQQFEMRVGPVHSVPAPASTPAPLAPSVPHSGMTPPSAGGYVAFNPNVPSRTPSPPRSAAPPTFYGNVAAATPTARSFTAPPPQNVFVEQRSQSPYRHPSQPQQPFRQPWQQPPPPQQAQSYGQERSYNGPISPSGIRRPELPTGGPRAATEEPWSGGRRGGW